MRYRDLENLGRVRLSENFFFREFLYSEVGNYYRISNIPVDPEFAIENGMKLCTELLEPLQKQFGRVFVRSGYRSPALNNFCSGKGLGCARNEKNYARHIWDMRDANGHAGAMACVVLPSYLEAFERTNDYKPIAHWVADHLPYSEIVFFKNLCAFNIGWHEQPKKLIESKIPDVRQYELLS